MDVDGEVLRQVPGGRRVIEVRVREHDGLEALAGLVQQRPKHAGLEAGIDHDGTVAPLGASNQQFVPYALALNTSSHIGCPC